MGLSAHAQVGWQVNFANLRRYFSRLRFVFKLTASPRLLISLFRLYFALPSLCPFSSKSFSLLDRYHLDQSFHPLCAASVSYFFPKIRTT